MEETGERKGGEGQIEVKRRRGDISEEKRTREKRRRQEVQGEASRGNTRK